MFVFIVLFILKLNNINCSIIIKNILIFYLSLNIYIYLFLLDEARIRISDRIWVFDIFALMHLFLCVIVFLVSGFDENLAVQGELILQDTFQVWDPKSLIRKGRDRHLFLFEISLVFSKEMKDSSGRTKYVYKNKLLVRSSRMTRCQEV